MTQRRQLQWEGGMRHRTSRILSSHPVLGCALWKVHPKGYLVLISEGNLPPWGLGKRLQLQVHWNMMPLFAKGTTSALLLQHFDPGKR